MPMPNHKEYDDLLLELVTVSDGGAAAWKSLLRSHFDSCDAGPGTPSED